MVTAATAPATAGSNRMRFRGNTPTPSESRIGISGTGPERASVEIRKDGSLTSTPLGGSLIPRLIVSVSSTSLGMGMITTMSNLCSSSYHCAASYRPARAVLETASSTSPPAEKPGSHR
eukprot:363136-Rhodomonas_salina.1